MANLAHGDTPTTNTRAPKVRDVIFTAADLVAIRKAEIEAAGGVVANVPRLTQVMTDLKDQGLLGRMRTLVVAECGWKLIDNRVDTLHAVDGVDWEGVALTGTGAKPAIVNNAQNLPSILTEIDINRSGGIVRTKQQIALADSAGGWASVFFVGEPVASRTLSLGFGNDPGANTGYVSATLARNAALSLITYLGQTSAYVPAGAGVSAAARMTENVGNGTYPAAVCVMMMLNVASGELRLIVDGAYLDNQISGTGTLYDYVALTQYLMAGGYYNGSSNIQSLLGGKWSVVGCLPEGTPQEHVNLCRAATKWGRPLP